MKYRHKHDTKTSSIYSFNATVKIIFIYFAGKSKDEAMSDYITKVKQLLEEAGLSA